MSKNKDFMVDAVITWVNGNDPVHASKLQEYLEVKEDLGSKSLKMRYNQVNEIEFAVKSILKYAKFVRNIFIVTDNQIPDFLKDKDFAAKNYPTVSIIDHSTIFKGHEAYLPTFNSRSIETLLYKIPEISEHYIYFNDDLFLLREAKLEDFFKDGYPVLRGSWKNFNENIFIKKLKNSLSKKTSTKKAGHKLAQEMGAKLAGFTKYYKFHHTPHPFRKSTLERYFSNNNDVKIENIKYKFRNSNQFIIQSLANHLEIKNKTCFLESDYKMVYFQNYKKPFWWIKLKLKMASKSKKDLFLCMQSLDQCPESKLNFIKKWLHTRYS